MCSPRVCGCSGKFFGFRAVRRTRRNGKKATRLCPCGHLGDGSVPCRCTPERIATYRGRISGPLLDRIDLHVDVPRVSPQAIAAASPTESSRCVAMRVERARAIQLARQGRANSRIEGVDVLTMSRATQDAVAMLDRAMRQLALSARAYHRVLRVARTIADLAACESVLAQHVSEAIQLRQLDRCATATHTDSIST